MTDFDIKILKEIANPGSQEGLYWGAAMGVALEYLQGKGFVTRGPRPQITESGKEFLSNN